jgi:molybdate transport system substrate-binding protein
MDIPKSPLLILAVAASLASATSDGFAAELKLMVTGSMAQPLREIAENFARNNGHTLNVTVGITSTVSATIRAGETPDLVEVTSVGMDALERENMIDPHTRVEVAHALIGVAVGAHASTPDISSAEALRRVLLEARSIAYVNPRFAGQVGVNLMTFLDRLGVREQVESKAVLTFTGTEAVEKAAKREADLALAFVSEILPVQGAKRLSPIPAALQVPTQYAAALGAKSAHRAVALALLREIGTANSARIIRGAGLEPIGTR